MIQLLNHSIESISMVQEFASTLQLTFLELEGDEDENEGNRCLVTQPDVEFIMRNEYPAPVNICSVYILISCTTFICFCQK